VIRRIRELRTDRIRRLETSGDEVVRRLLLLASSNIKDYLEYDGYSIRIKPSDDLSREQAFCINEIKERVARDGSRSLEFKLHDKKPVLALLAQHFGLLDGSAGAPDPLEKAKEFKTHLDNLLNSIPLEPEEEFER
jgi:phage terminase small subunit